MSYRFGKLWHLAIIWAVRKAFQCILEGVRFLLANHTRISPTSENESYPIHPSICPSLLLRSPFSDVAILHIGKIAFLLGSCLYSVSSVSSVNDRSNVSSANPVSSVKQCKEFIARCYLHLCWNFWFSHLSALLGRVERTFFTNMQTLSLILSCHF